MDRVTCPECGYTVGLGMAAEFGHCPSCDVPLMLTCEMRALTPDEVRRAVARELEREASAVRD